VQIIKFIYKFNFGLPGGRNNIPPLRQAPLVVCHTFAKLRKLKNISILAFMQNERYNVETSSPTSVSPKNVGRNINPKL
jgi:hypothetical protein